MLLAEDHPTNRKVVELILTSVGVDLTCVENGKEAVEASAATAFDLILMDMQMPVMERPHRHPPDPRARGGRRPR